MPSIFDPIKLNGISLSPSIRYDQIIIPKMPISPYILFK